MSLPIGITHKSQQKYKGLIYKVLHQLPPEIRKQIREECFVWLVGYSHGDHFGYIDRDVIVLNTRLMDENGLCEAQELYVIAHEFAHHILNHPSPMKGGMKEQHEKEADALAEKWGFPFVKK